MFPHSVSASLADAEIAENSGNDRLGHGLAGDLAERGDRALCIHHDSVRRHAALSSVQRRFAAFCGARERGGLTGVCDQCAVKRSLSEADGARNERQQTIHSLPVFADR